MLHSDRLDRLERPDQTFQVIVETGASQQAGLMAINSPFNAGIGFDESEMYNKMSQTRLRDLSNLPFFTAGGITLNQKIDTMLSHLTAVMKEQVVADYSVFPVLLNQEITENRDYYIILNELDIKFGVDIPMPYGKIAELSGLNNRTIPRYINGEEVLLDAPKGYGVSPLLKIYRILEFVFENFGFTIEENPFKEHRQLKKLVVLNNVMDAILTGTLYYRDMMPDITIKSFLDGLYNKFGMQYFLNSNSKTVKLKFLNDTLIPMKSGSINLDNYKIEEPQINYSSPKQLKLVANTEIELAKPLFNTFEEFLKVYNYQFTDRYGDSPLPAGVTSFFVASEYRYSIMDVRDGNTVSSSDFFDWDKKDNLPYQEIKMDDLCLPLTNIGGNLCLFYSADCKHLYSDVILSWDTAGLRENPAKLAFAFGWGLTKHTASNRYNYFLASQVNRDENGNFMYDSEGKKYDISLTCNREDGLFNRFWKRYDAFLRHSNFEVKCKLKLSEMEIFNLDMFKTVLINNQPLLPKQIKYKLNQKDSRPAECSFQALRLYEPCNLEVEQEIPVYIAQKYYWDWASVEIPDPENYRPYKIISGYSNTGVWINEVEIPTKKVTMMPPTEEEFQNQEKRILTYEFDIQRLTSPFSKIKVRQTVTYIPKLVEY